jgi:hypothetical protein
MPSLKVIRRRPTPSEPRASRPWLRAKDRSLCTVGGAIGHRDIFAFTSWAMSTAGWGSHHPPMQEAENHGQGGTARRGTNPDPPHRVSLHSRRCSMDTVPNIRNVASPQARPNAMLRLASSSRAESVRIEIPADRSASVGQGRASRPELVFARAFRGWRPTSCARRAALAVVLAPAGALALPSVLDYHPHARAGPGRLYVIPRRVVASPQPERRTST